MAVEAPARQGALKNRKHAGYFDSGISVTFT